MTSPFLLYHKIDHPSPDAKVRGAFTPSRVFERQLKFLLRKGTSFLSASDMVRHYLLNGSLPSRTVAVTFDDGWKDNYTNAFPLLKRYGIPATIFIVPEMLGKTSARVTAEGEGPREHMSVDDVREMSGAGIEFGSHSMSHALLHQVSEDEARREIFGSKAAIEEVLQKECSVFAYPAGFFTVPVRQMVIEAGYIAGFSTVYGPEENTDLFALNRTEVLRKDRLPFAFSHKVAPLVR
ncbi:MAG: polysaccharide deacetylase family protein [Pyrinomonadaceae bacterium]